MKKLFALSIVAISLLCSCSSENKAASTNNGSPLSTYVPEHYFDGVGYVQPSAGYFVSKAQSSGQVRDETSLFFKCRILEESDYWLNFVNLAEDQLRVDFFDNIYCCNISETLANNYVYEVSAAGIRQAIIAVEKHFEAGAELYFRLGNPDGSPFQAFYIEVTCWPYAALSHAEMIGG